ncbi:MAG: DUF2993 domain-containing protein [Pseudonocardiaceae bacterium]|nr:DUF2993 domain-containing protein [Pseudonocardiaceae bacterium]
MRMTTATKATNKRKRRGKKRLVITLVVLLGLLVAADFAAATAAEYQVSKQARQQFKLKDDPSVSVNGFPFLTQAIAGKYNEISVHAAGIPVANTLREVQLDAKLRRVHAPLSEVLSGNAKAIRIEEVEGQVKITATDIGRAVGIPKMGIEPVSERRVRIPEEDDESGQDDEDLRDAEPEDNTTGLRLDASTNVAGEETNVSVFAMLTLSGHKVDIRPERIELRNELTDVDVPDFVRNQIFDKFSVDLNPGALPFKVKPTAVTAESGALMVKGTAANLRFDQ